MTQAAETTSDRVGIARPNAINVFVSSVYGLMMVHNCTANVTSIPGATTVQVNLPANHPAFTVGTKYILGGQLLDDATHSTTPLLLQNAVFKGYGTGVLSNVGIFVGMIVSPE